VLDVGEPLFFGSGQYHPVADKDRSRVMKSRVDS
jgi:hypothetical protein